MSIGAPCKRDFRARLTEGKRNEHDITLVVLHVAENANARNIASFFTRATTGSAHLVVGETSCYRCLDNEDIPVAAAGANTIGFHIEQAGFAGWTLDQWKAHEKTLRRAAYKTAIHLHKFGLRPRWRNAGALINGHRHGVTSHREVNVWQAHIGAPGDHSHTCPGTTWPREQFMDYVHEYFEKLEGRH